MPSVSQKQRRFFFAVKNAKHNPNAPKHLKKVADSMTDSDIDDFTKSLAELKTKKVMVSILKDIQEPMYLQENEELDDKNIEAVADTFHVNEEWSKYIKPYIGQPLLPKELEAIETFKEKQPTTVSRTEIWYKSTDSFSISHTTVIKKMKDSGQFSFIAFQKQDKPEAEEDNNNNQEPQGQSPEMMNGQTPAPMPSTSPTEKEEKDDIIVTKSILFRDDIKGASILAKFLKKLDL